MGNLMMHSYIYNCNAALTFTGIFCIKGAALYKNSKNICSKNSLQLKWVIRKLKTMHMR